MENTVKVGFDDLREAAIALNEFETSLGAMLLTDTLESMLTGRSKTAEGLTKIVNADKASLESLARRERKFEGKIVLGWEKTAIAKDIAEIGPEKVLDYLKRSVKELGDDRNREAAVMAKTVRMIDLKDSASAFDRAKLDQAFAAVAMDRKTGKLITDKEAAQVRGAAIAALGKLPSPMRRKIRVWSGTAPLPKLMRRKLHKMWGWRPVLGGMLLPLPGTGTGAGQSPQSGSPPPAFTELRFNLHRVECIEDTRGGEIGPDEIELGGARTNGTDGVPPNANIGVFGPTPVGDFKSGDTSSFSPPHVLHNWALPGLDFPHAFAVLLLMSEKDANEKFVDILEAVAQEGAGELEALITAIAAAAGAAIGAGIGTALGTTIAPIIGSLIGLVIGTLVGLIGAWASNALNPEVFENIREDFVVLEGPHAFPDGTQSTPVETADYIDHGGHYQVRYNWSLH